MSRSATAIALTNCEIYTGTSVESGKAVIVRGSVIADLVNDDSIPADCEVADLGGLTVAPGFIDAQVNGGGGRLFNDAPAAETLRTIVEAHRRYGTLNLLPTYITGPAKGMRSARDAVLEYRASDAGVLGIHFEGPFISRERPGVHDRAYIRPPTESDVSIVTSGGVGLTVCTLAPEVTGCELVSRLVEAGVLVSFGHSDATYEEAMAGFHAGGRCATHLFNAMSRLTARGPGLVGAALTHPDAWAGVIADGHHVHFASIEIARAAMGQGRLFLVTDAMPPVGGAESGFRLGPYDVTVENGRCLTAGGVLAGAGLDMATAVRNCVRRLGLPRDEALRMASTYPAVFLGVDDRLGHVAPGYTADLCVLDDELHVAAVVASGRLERFD